MGFQAIISTIATIVSIVGGVIGIISALSKEPVFLRFWQRQASQQAPAVVPPAPGLSKPLGERASAPHVLEQTQQSLPASRVKIGIVYGVVLGVLSISIIIGAQAVYLQSYSSIPAVFAYSGMGMLSIAAGLLPSRVSGSLLSSAIAGAILGGVSFFAVIIDTLLLYLPFSSFLGFVLFGVLPFLISLLFGLLGRYLHNKLQANR